ncbi:serine/threonine protein phosphatase PP1 isozyme, putative [Entamoeba invadens IP1]|uniref:Serine/threonine protein phosphatase PP1 isozyme, putative n=1 Tax=Entamoeba invadens IP1 TaxID=370355 RepID=A0A0A1U6U6_ENTIV|nr:serine/threonine protein phosphatase PP1 isozyme, putative [Entamoeba invadens IP1]ELP90138.1 serine/threonine protein phosphatase PP1 isozyme, putative [Entamoeba invadens IP1]|eukprot:XP_004256909.1 serine/threonine protein phosphatase PP1 isozyme, putative [Entamoeba invadens IP1]
MLTPRVAKNLFQHLRSNILPRNDFLRLTHWATVILRTRPSLVYLPPHPGTLIVGDLHGQYNDLFRVIGGGISKQIVFNGDFVDRGYQGIEVITALMAALCSAPDKVFLSRGNHEDPDLHILYGFRAEAFSKYDPETYGCICEFFRALPYAHVIGNSIFVVHGGLAPTPFTLKDVVALPRVENFMQNADVPELAQNLLWSDPMNGNGWVPSIRGIGCKFGTDITKRFLDANNLDLIIRSHEVKMKGYEYACEGRVLTVFSAGRYGGGPNSAAIVDVNFDGGMKGPSVNVMLLPNGALPPITDETVQVVLSLLVVTFIVVVDYLIILLS